MDHYQHSMGNDLSHTLRNNHEKIAIGNNQWCGRQQKLDISSS